jgi:hypothetical protein
MLKGKKFPQMNVSTVMTVKAAARRDVLSLVTAAFTVPLATFNVRSYRRACRVASEVTSGEVAFQVVRTRYLALDHDFIINCHRKKLFQPRHQLAVLIVVPVWLISLGFQDLLKFQFLPANI